MSDKKKRRYYGGKSRKELAEDRGELTNEQKLVAWLESNKSRMTATDYDLVNASLQAWVRAGGKLSGHTWRMLRELKAKYRQA